MRLRQRRNSFTLIELLVVIVIIGVIAGASLPPLSRFLELWLFNNNRMEVLWSTRGALRDLTFNARMVANRASVTTTTATRFRFTTTGNAIVDYQLSNGALYKGAVILLPEASCPNNTCFTYLACDKNNACAANSATFNTVKIDITATRSGESVSLDTAVNCRNLN